jgi:hypothetical protein
MIRLMVTWNPKPWARVFIAAVFLLTGSGVTVGAQEILWSRTYGDDDAETAFAADRAVDGGFVLFGYADAGANDDFLLVKTDPSGNLLWSRSWDGEDTDWGRAVRQLPGGDLLVAGMSGTNGGGHDMYLGRTDAAGNLLWQRFFGEAGIDERAHDVQPTADGGFVLVGQKRVGGFPFDSYDVWLVKTDGAGDLLWDRLYAREDFGNDIGLAVEETDGGGYIIGGLTQSSDWACYLLRTDALGNLVWENTYGGGSAGGECNDVRQTQDGGFVGTGCATPSGDCDAYLVRTDGAGAVLWEQYHGGSSDDSGQAVLELPDGGYAIAGQTASEGAGGWDVYVVRTDETGNALWTQTFGGTSDDRGFSALATTDGKLAVAGWFASPGNLWLDALLVKIDADTALFADGFESGDLSAWDSSVP